MRRICTKAFTLVELLISMALAVVIIGVLLIGFVTFQRSFYASMQYARSQADQARVLDYMALDLRRALSVSTTNGELNISIPDFYDEAGEPRMPTITRSGFALYGTAGAPKAIRYYKNADTIVRVFNGVSEVIARKVEDFNFNFTDLGQVIQVSISFTPTFQQSIAGRETARSGTSATVRTLLRNRRES